MVINLIFVFGDSKKSDVLELYKKKKPKKMNH